MRCSRRTWRGLAVSMTAVGGAALLFSAALAASASRIQQAQQAGAEAAAGTAFTSPMVLTAKFAAADQSLWGKGEWFTTDEYLQLSRFTCEGVSFSGAVDAKGKTTRPGLEFAHKLRPDGLEEIRIRVKFWSPPRNKDKSVSVVVEVLDGNVTVRRVTIGPLDVEEGHTPQHGESSLLFPLNLLRRPLTMRLTVTVANRLEG